MFINISTYIYNIYFKLSPSNKKKFLTGYKMHMMVSTSTVMVSSLFCHYTSIFIFNLKITLIISRKWGNSTQHFKAASCNYYPQKKKEEGEELKTWSHRGNLSWLVIVPFLCSWTLFEEMQRHKREIYKSKYVYRYDHIIYS